jgi:hypothetical protein
MLFETFYVCKPITSKPANSEIYLVGKYFRGISDDMKISLLARVDNWPTDEFVGPLIDEIYYGPVDNMLLRVANDLFMDQQVAFINELSILYAKYKEVGHGLRDILRPYSEVVQLKWLRDNPMKKLDEKDEIIEKKYTGIAKYVKKN